MTRTEPGQTSGRRYGVIDIGSNSVRLVVFEGHPRAPWPVFNEKALCGLGRELATTGRLHPRGVELAFQNLPRYAALAAEMGVPAPHVLATAAVREADDGLAFVARVEAECGLKVSVISGDQEASLSGYGVISGNPRATGVMGDLGGGSLELVYLSDGEAVEQATLPLGPFRLIEAARHGHEPRAVLAEGIAGLDWLDTQAGGEFHAVGGAWRALARIHMAQTGYPLDIIDRYTVSRSDMEGVVDLIARAGPESLSRLPGVPGRRLEALPTASMLMKSLMDVVRPERVVYSAHGLREGVLFAALSEAQRAEDPLFAAARDFARRHSRFVGFEEALVGWTGALFPEESPEQARRRRAACILGDIGWAEHPSYRARHSFERVLRFAASGIDHSGRAFVGVVIAARYGGSEIAEYCDAVASLGIDEAGLDDAVCLGLAIRLGFGLCGGNAEILADSSLSIEKGVLVLTVGPAGAPLVGEMIERRLRELAGVLELDWRVDTKVRSAKAS